MLNIDKSNEYLVAELSALRQRVSELESSYSTSRSTLQSIFENNRRYRLLAENIADII